MRRTLWPLLDLLDWSVLAVLLVLPIYSLWRLLRQVREITNETYVTGLHLVMGGYLPLWFGLTLVEKALNR
jgi:hypothetical protein